MPRVWWKNILAKSSDIHLSALFFIYLFFTLPFVQPSLLAEDEIPRPQRTKTAMRPPAYTAPIHQGAHPNTPTISGEDSDLYKHYYSLYTSSSGAAWVSAVLERASPWMGHIRERIVYYGLPPELAYLPIVESSFVPQAVSKSGAVGLWQFMKNSIAPFDIRVSEWMDERRDFWKASDGALRKLKENYDALGDWELALAAYNAGLGAMRTAIKKSGTKNFQELSNRGFLKKETEHYVPKFRALADAIAEGRRNGITMGWEASPEWERIALNRSVDLKLLAKAANIDVELLRLGNMELSWGVSPPSASYFLKVPRQDVEAVKTVLAQKDLPLVHYYIHIIKSGDTLSALSRHYGISVKTIEETNPGIQARFLRLNQKVLIPALKEVAPYVRAAREDRFLRFDGSYTVKKGDTLWSIALAHGVDPEVLAEENGLSLSGIIREGQSLKTPIL